MKNKGFSLIELIVVIAIMAVIVAVIAPNLTKYLGKSREKVDSTNLLEVKNKTMTCITDAQISNVNIISGEDGIKNATYILEYDNSQGKVVATVGNNGVNNFADILTNVFSEATVKSKLNKDYVKIEIVINGQVSSGYDVSTKFIS